MTVPERRHHVPKVARRSAGWVLVVAVLFTIPALTIDFFHIEHDGLVDDNCPACQLQKSVTAAGTAAAPELPAPSLQISPKTAEQPNIAIFLGIRANSRSPPSA